MLSRNPQKVRLLSNKSLFCVIYRTNDDRDGYQYERRSDLSLRISIERPAPATLQAGSIDEIRRIVPQQPGIYAMFYADIERCFYVGSSVKSIRERLLTHYGKDADKNYRGKLGELRTPEKFRFWFHLIARPPEISGYHFKCVVTALEVMCSAAWEPEVESKKF